jgi:hypothetical protein
MLMREKGVKVELGLRVKVELGLRAVGCVRAELGLSWD